MITPRAPSDLHRDVKGRGVEVGDEWFDFTYVLRNVSFFQRVLTGFFFTCVSFFNE